MFERSIEKQAVIEIIRSGEVIAEYSDDKPYPSFLLLGFVNQLPVHVVLGKNEATNDCYVITVYLPSSDIWQEGYRKRRST
jgi:hypothetical protein